MSFYLFTSARLCLVSTLSVGLFVCEHHIVIRCTPFPLWLWLLFETASWIALVLLTYFRILDITKPRHLGELIIRCCTLCVGDVLLRDNKVIDVVVVYLWAIVYRWIRYVTTHVVNYVRYILGTPLYLI